MTSNTSIKNIISVFSTQIDIIDIELIIAHVLKKDRVFVITHRDQILSQDTVDIIDHLCTKRAAGYPLAYITGYKEFFGRSFFVSEHTLIPRAETEILITSVIDEVKNGQLSDIMICDIGTGSGIIPITLQKELQKNISKFQIIASDISQKALDIAQKNLSQHCVSHIPLYKEDLLSGMIFDLCKNTSAKDIFITANLPYVHTRKKEFLISQKNSCALQYEPDTSLWSGDAGMAHYKNLIVQTSHLIKILPKNKTVFSFYEIDPDQTEDILSYIRIHDPHGTLSCTKDLAQKDRLITWKTYT